jgi:hypothetical protein
MFLAKLLALGRGNLRNEIIMEANSDTAGADGLALVRAKARMQRNVRFNKTESQDVCQLGEKDSLQGIRTLKQKELEEYTPEPQPTDNALDQMWDWFLRTIGNR